MTDFLTTRSREYAEGQVLPAFFNSGRCNDVSYQMVAKDGINILRCKGILNLKDDPDRFVFQGVHMILDGDHQRPWKKDEHRDSRIVFIGRNLPEAKIREGFESCVA